MLVVLVAVAMVAFSGGAVVNRAAQQRGPVDPVDPGLTQIMARDGAASYLVFLQEQANLASAAAITDRDAQGWFVYQSLAEVANRTQSPLVSFLEAERSAGRVTFVQSYFSANAIGVRSSADTLAALAVLPGIERIIPAPVVTIPTPTAGVEEPRIDAIEWNVHRVRAPEVWAQGVRGEGIVVASIDTGVEYTHPAIEKQYRGNLGGGAFDHNYNWSDPSSICGSPSLAPCDSHSHGTHVTGTMVGDAGGANQIGVAPRAKWIACKGCEGSSCSSFALLECADFVLAPTDLAGLNPDPSKRPTS
jgi:subtilisin family serine protease